MATTDTSIPNAGSAASTAEEPPKRASFRVYPSLLFGASLAVSVVPVFGAGASLALDRMRNRSNANHELDVRAKNLSKQVGQTLGMSANRVRGSDLVKAAQINKGGQIERAVVEVVAKERKENSSSLLINAGVAAASVAGVGWVGKLGEGVSTGSKVLRGGVQMAKVTAGSLAGGALAGVLHKDKVNSTEILEAAQTELKRAKEEGLPASNAINHHMMFVLRVLQDDAMHKELEAFAKKNYGKPFHQLGKDELDTIMAQKPELAMATQRETRAIENGIDIREIVAAPPFLGEGFAGPMARSDNVRTGHAAKEMARRAMNNSVNDNGAMTNAERIRLQQSTRAADQGLTA